MKQRWIAVVLSAAVLAACEGGGRSAESPSVRPGGPADAANIPTRPSTPTDLGVFADVRGWIVYGNDEGIWAVNPTPGGTPPVQLSERPGDPIAWSADGSKLLIRGESSDTTRNPFDDLALYVLDADGTTTRLTGDLGWGTGSISPDGSKVIYDRTTHLGGNHEWQSGIYIVDTEGGEPRLLLAAGLQDYSDYPDGSTFRTALFRPTFSPDGTQIAYLDGMGDWGNTVRVMNADGSGVRVLVDWSTLPPPPAEEFGEVFGSNLAWSSDGLRLTFNGSGGTWIIGVDGDGLTNLPVGDPDDFVLPGEVDWVGGARWSPTAPRLAFRSEGAIWVINGDGSGLAQVTPSGYDPVWSPDGDQIALREGGSLYVVPSDGGPVRTLIAVEPTATKSSCARQETPHCYAPVVWNPAPASASGS